MDLDPQFVSRLLKWIDSAPAEAQKLFYDSLAKAGIDPDELRALADDDQADDTPTDDGSTAANAFRDSFIRDAARIAKRVATSSRFHGRPAVRIAAGAPRGSGAPSGALDPETKRHLDRVFGSEERIRASAGERGSLWVDELGVLRASHVRRGPTSFEASMKVLASRRPAGALDDETKNKLARVFGREDLPTADESVTDTRSGGIRATHIFKRRG
jgi:hypothetical protein